MSPPQPIRLLGLTKLIIIKSLIFFPTTSLKCLRAARIDELADSNESAKSNFWVDLHLSRYCGDIAKLGNIVEPINFTLASKSDK